MDEGRKVWRRENAGIMVLEGGWWDVYVLKLGLWEEALVQDGKGNVAVVCRMEGWQIQRAEDERGDEDVAKSVL